MNLNFSSFGEPLHDAETPAEMRKAINVYARNDGLTHQVFQAAYMKGLNDADTYVGLAYYALRVLAETRDKYLDELNRKPVTTLFHPSELTLKTERGER